MVFKIGKIRAGFWVLLLAVTLLVAALYKLPGVYRSNALLECLPSVIAGILTVMGVYAAGAMTAGVRIGVVGAALLLGNFSFLEAGRSISTSPDLFVLALQSWLFFGVMLLRRSRIWPVGLAVMFGLSLAAYASWPYATIPSPWYWRGIITGIFGALGAAFFLLQFRRSRGEDWPVWLGAILWGVFNLFLPGNTLLLTLAPAALLGSWLLNNCAHTLAVKVASDGILLALRLVPLFMVVLWVFSWWNTRDNGIQVPMLLPLTLLAILTILSLRAVRFFKYADRRVMIVISAACCVAVWQLMLIEPVRLQQTPPAEPKPVYSRPQPAETLDVEVDSVIKAAP